MELIINQISALICPLFDHTSLAVVSALNESDIPVILPNNRKEDLTKIYRNTFLISSTIALEAKLAANFAVNQLKLDSLAVLAPADKYGQIQMDSFIKEVDRFFNWLKKSIGIEVKRSWVIMYDKGQGADKHNHKEYATTFSYGVSIPDGSSSLSLSGDEVNMSAGEVIAFPGKLFHHVLPSDVDGRCILVGHG